ncbi:MAG: hypothetical protein ACK4K7_15375 [Allosphingosinicella sp.]|uniref:hypothetical protein n=1 Tax=Allosphingosinicella sp. TaxID=2823234 RepID=UPI00393DFA27
MEEDHIYFARRADEQRAAADAAFSDKARALHLELARLFDSRAHAAVRDQAAA